MTSRPILILAGCLAGVLAAAAAVAVAQPLTLPIDKETTIAGIPVACTGVGQTRLDPKWAAYPVRIEFSNAKSEYLTDGEITLKDSRGTALLTVSCAGPWILLKLPAGSYRVDGRIPGTAAKPKSAAITPPARGQTRFVLQFPDL